jgi:5'-nucleotidase
LNILLTNDDGLAAHGLGHAYRALTARGHKVAACAPNRERSGSSQSITLGRLLGAKPMTMPDGAVGWSVDGSPADCARLGFTLLAPWEVDLVVSGINDDLNLGYDANYSGTVAAALEAAGAGLPALAVSLERPGAGHSGDGDWLEAAAILADAAELMPGWDIPAGVMVNLNIPCPIRDPEWVWTTLNPHASLDFYTEVSPEAGSGWLRRRDESMCQVDDGSDLAWNREGRVTLTPLVPTAHHARTLDRLRPPAPARAQKSL